jgi:8-oxo-dGTP pyrophosphatase MutT (NUDIX family)
MKPWTILKSRVSYEDSWIRLRTDTVELPDGSILESYHVVEYADWVNIIALTDRDSVVLVKQYRHPVASVQWEFPGGAINDGEPLEEAAKRELLEETGYGGGQFFNLGTLNALAGRIPTQFHTFVATGVEKHGNPRPDASESLSPVELPWSDFIGRLPLKDANDMASLMLLSSFAAKSSVPAIRELRFS